MRVLFLGLPLAACLLRADGHELVHAALSRPEIGTRRIRRLLGADRVSVRPALDAAFVERARALSPDLLVSWFWTNRIPPALVETARLGAFGVHPSLLPRHRGPDPTSWAILSGDVESGVTAHRIAPAYDTGAILDAEALPIDPSWNAWDLARALDRPSLRVLRRVARAFAEGRPPEERPQDPAAATLAPFPSEDDQRLSFAEPTDQVLRRIRALAPAPGAFTEVGGATVAILRARAVAAPDLLERPGEAVALGGRVLVRTGDGAIEVLAAELDGEDLASGDLADRVERAAAARKDEPDLA